MAFDLVGKAVKNLRLPTVNYNNSPIKIIPAQEGDINSRFFSVTLFDDRGNIPLTPYTKATLNATLPNGEVQIAEGEIDKEKNIAICKIAGSMLSQLGKVSCDVLLTGKDSTNTDTSLTSQTFYLFVAKSQAGDNAIAGSDDYTLLVQLLNEVSELEDNIETAEEARVAAEQARVDEYAELAGDMEEAIDNINAAAGNAAKVEEIYNKMQITFFYDEEGYVCYKDKVEA